jgi:hypothetical protein
MKKIFVLAAALCLTAGLYAQKREGNVVKVQGHVHELLTKQAAGKEAAKKVIQTPVGNVYNINPDSITCWVGCVNTSLPVDTAYLLIKWTDGKAAERGDNDSILIWGYVWNPQQYFNKYSIDMIRAVANFDCKFSTLQQNTGGGDFTVGGFGYNFEADRRVPIEFDYAGAKRESDLDTIHFNYETMPNCPAPYNQFALPEDPDPTTLAEQAIAASENTGVIKHPFDAAYSYPAYDYDYWKLAEGYENDPNYEWQAGWTYGYWAFYVREGLSGTFDYAAKGEATQQLNNNSVHYFIFASTDYEIPVSTDGEYANPECCATFCTNCPTPTAKK